MLDFTRLMAAAGGLLLMCALTGAAQASSVERLFEAEVEVFGQNEDERRKAFATALWDVLVKVTGDRSVPSRPEVQPLFRGAGKLVQQYQYREIERPEPETAPSDEPFDPLAIDVDPDVNVDPGVEVDAPTHILWIQFAPETVERQLSRLGIALWGKERPQTLVWLAVADGRQRYLLGTGTDNEVSAELHSVAEQRGVPILLPVMDVADRTAVRFADVRGNFVQPVWDASRRYGVESILAGNLTRMVSGGWQAQWTLHRRGNTSSWRVQSSDITAGLLSGVEGVASVLSRELAVGHYGAKAGRTLLTIHDVDAIADYSQVVAYLRGLSLVKEVMVERIAEDRLTVALQLRGNPEDLQRTIALGDTLIALRDGAGNPGANRVLQYAYLP